MIFNPFNVYKGNRIKKTRIGGYINKRFWFNKKSEPIINDVYLVLRPDKDKKANMLFPDKVVVYLRYDKPKDLLLINKYKSL